MPPTTLVLLSLLVVAAPPQQQKPQLVPGPPVSVPKPVARPLPDPLPPPRIVVDGNEQVFPTQGAQDVALPTDEELGRVSVSAELVRLARTLDSDAFSERAAARKSILDRKPTPDELMALLLRTDLGQEARHQLVGILRDRIVNAPRGALGIRMENFPDKDGGVRIIAIVPDMPAEKVLQVGDVVKRVNDTPLRSTLDLVNTVQTLPPGSEVKLVFRRLRKGALAPVAPAGAPPANAADPMEELEATIRLGSTEELNEKGDPALGGVIIGTTGASYQRMLTAQLAAKRFLSTPKAVEFPGRTVPADEKPAVTIDSVRKLLAELQLSDGDADLVRTHRMRLEQLAEQMARVGNQMAERARLQRALEALEIEIRGSF